MNVPNLGELVIDVSYGGNFYAIVDVQKNFKGLEHYPADQLIAWARELRKNINANMNLFIRKMQQSMDVHIFFGQEQ